MPSKTWKSLAVLSFILALRAGPADALQYTVTDLGTLPGGTTSNANAINSSGQIAGISEQIAGNIAESVQAFLYSNGSMQDLGTLGGPTSAAYGINDSGQVVGQADINAAGVAHAFLYSGGSMHDIDTLGSEGSVANGINASGQIVGQVDLEINSAFAIHAFLYSGGSMQDLGTLPGGTFSSANAINASGQIVGGADTPGSGGVSHAFLYSNGTMQDLGTLGGNSSSASGINASGQIVGSAFLSGDTVGHAFLYSNGKMQDLGTLAGNTESVAEGINDSGQIVGRSFGDAGGGRIGGNAEYGFLYRGGTMLNLNSLEGNAGWELEEATAINDAGDIVGDGVNPAGQEDAFPPSPPFPSPQHSPMLAAWHPAGCSFAGEVNPDPASLLTSPGSKDPFSCR